MYPQILGVYSNTKSQEVGAGTTSRAAKQQTYWFVRRINNDDYEIQPLNASNVPSGMRTTITKGELIQNYEPEPGYYESRTLPALKSLQKKVELGEKFFRKGLLGQAEKEFLKAIMVDDQHAEANLGLGAVYCEQKEFQKVKKVIGVLLNNDDAFKEEQRQQFNTFGISLRKQGMHGEAIRFYQRALEVDPNDEHLHFNLARVHLDNGDDLECLKHVETSLKLNPKFDAGQKFLNYLSKRG